LRKTQIVHSNDDFTDEDMIPDESVVITISHEGYLKRTLLSEYKTQGRGGFGSKGAGTKESDFTEHLLVATNHNYLLIFTESGKVFWLRAFEVPEGSKTAKGRPIQNVINIDGGDKVRSVLIVKDLKDQEYIDNNFVIMCTEKGTIKKTSLEAYSRPRQGGINAISINEGDRLLDVRLTNGSSEIIIALRCGRAIRFNESRVRPMGRTATGVRGVSLEDENDYVVGMVSVNSADQNLLVVSENGYGKRSELDEYRITNRGGKGVKTMNITDKTGSLVAIKDVTDSDDLMIINKSGITIRLEVAGLRLMGRATQGVRLIKINEGDAISSVAVVKKDEAVGEVTEIIPIENLDNGTDAELDDSEEPAATE
jgi:DNA gyrase subunit A